MAARELSMISPAPEPEPEVATAPEPAADPTCASCRCFKPQLVHNAGVPMGRCRLEPGGILVESFDWCSHHERR